MAREGQRENRRLAGQGRLLNVTSGAYVVTSQSDNRPAQKDL